jgi:hypothetical protein
LSTVPYPHSSQGGEAAFTLLGLNYTPLATPFRRGSSLRETVADLADAVGDEATKFMGTIEREFDEYALGSTLNSPYTSDPTMWRDDYHARIAAHVGKPPDYAVNVYECTNWAFILRYALAKSRVRREPRKVFMQIVDADIHGMQVAWKTKTYGFARFGVLSASVLVDGSVDGMPVNIGKAPVDHSMIKFGSAVRQVAQSHADATLCLPFFPQPTRDAFRRSVVGCSGLPDLHDQYGHCFGADPWIALGTHHGGVLGSERQYVLGSLALNGYYATSSIKVTKETRSCIGVPT